MKLRPILSRLAEEVAGGEEIIITKAGRPTMKLVPIAKSPKQRKLGMLKGKMRIAKDFDAPLPDELLDSFEGRFKDEGFLGPHILLWCLQGSKNSPRKS